MDPGRAAKQPESRKSRVFFRVLLDASILLTAISTCLFLFGWAYLVGWYGVFGLDLETLDLPVYLMLVASLNPLMDLIGKLLPSGEIVGFLIFCAVALFIVSETFYVRRLTRGTLTKHLRWPRKGLGELSDSGNKIIVPLGSSLPTLEDRLSIATLSWLRKALYPPLFLLFILILIVFSNQHGKKAGETEYQRPSIKITLGFKKEEIQLFDKELVSANSEGKLMELVQTKDLVLVFVKCGSRKVGDGVFIIPRVNLLFVHNEPLQNK